MLAYSGLDWGTKEHAVCVVDQAGRVLFERIFPHSDRGLADLVESLTTIASAKELRIAIERPNGLIVDTLVAAGFIVVPIHPNTLKACRPRYRAAGGKSDPGDAYMLADVLRTDGHRFQELEPDSDRVKALRSRVRTRDDLVTAKVALGHQLRALLESFWPGPVGLFSRLDCVISLAFIEQYPTPHSAKRLGLKRMSRFLSKHGYSGGRTAEDLLDRLNAAPQGQVGPEEEVARGQLCRILVQLIRNQLEAIRAITKDIETTVREIPMGEIVLSFPGNADVNAAKLIAEIGSTSRFPNAQCLAAESGVAPVTYQSGKHRGVIYRRACNTRLRVAMTCFADCSRRTSKWADYVYKSARARGCDHPHAIRILARAWTRVLWAALQSGEPYDVTQHRAAQAFVSAG